MTANHLPEDLDRWPRDAFEVLGVAETVDERSLKQAYTRLIKRFKPEQWPDHFQRLRESYDRARQLLAWKAMYRELQDNTEDTIAEPEASATTNANEPTTLPPAPPRIDPMVAAWDKALEGDAAAAYALLTEHEAAQPRGPGGKQTPAELYLELYWLLKLRPDLDLCTNASEWLLRGLVQGVQDWRLFNLLQRAVEHDPDEAFRPEFIAAFVHVEPELLALLLDVRWRAADRLQRTAVVLEELERYRPRMVFDAASSWGRLLVSALDRTLLKPHPGLDSLKPYVRELESAPLNSVEGHFERIDLLVEMAETWPRLSKFNIPYGWVEVLEQAAARDPRSKAVEALVAEIAAHPVAALKKLDFLRRSIPAAATILFQMLDEYCSPCVAEVSTRQAEVPPPALTQNLGTLLGSGNYNDEASHELLRFCIDEAISPSDMAILLDQLHPQYNWQAIIDQDRSIHHVYAAWLTFSVRSCTES